MQEFRRNRRATSPVSVIFRKETLDLLRDRRAVFFGLLLPLLLYPLLYIGMASATPEDRSEKSLVVGMTGAFEPFLAVIDGERLTVEEGGLDREKLRSGDPCLYVEFEPPPGGAGAQHVTVHYLSTSPDSREALRRVREGLGRFREKLLDIRLRDAGLPAGASKILDVSKSDLSSDRDRSLAHLGRFLPLLLVLMLLGGSSFVALDLVAGEKERGTLETLYVHPVSSRSIVWGKFLTLLLASFVAALVNTAGLLLSFLLGQATGWAPAGIDASATAIPPASVLGGILLLVLPLVVLTSALSLAVSARSKSFREAQTHLFPLTLGALALVLPAMAPNAKLDSILCLLPIANTALAVRELLQGQAELLPLAVAFLSCSLYAVLLLVWVARLLRREDIVLNLASPYLLSDARAEGRAKRAIIFGAGMLLFLYYAASWVQARSPYVGLAVTLWGLVLVPALVYPLVVKVPFRKTLGLESTRRRNYLFVLPLAASVAVLVTAYMKLQDEVLQSPREIEEIFREFFGEQPLGTVSALLLFAVSPAICEELLWRGTFQGELEPRGKPVTTVILVGLFFGMFHQSIYRLVPTGLLGAVLAVVRQRTGSIFPCMILHGVYNGGLFLLLGGGEPGRLDGVGALMGSPWVLVLAAVALPACIRAMRPRQVDS